MGDVSDQTKIEVLVRQHGKCGICGDALGDNPEEYHHMLPPRFGGDDSPDNIVALCDRQEHIYMHGGDFRNEIETTPDVYPYYNGGDPDEDPVDVKSVDKAEETVDDENLSNDNNEDPNMEGKLI